MIFFARLVQEYNPVMSLSHFGAVNACLIVSWLFRIPVRIAYYHTSADYEYLVGMVRFLQELKKIRKILVYKFATLIISVSKNMVDEVRNIYKVPKQKIRHFHNALRNPEMYSPAENIDPKNLICVGRLNYGKGFDILIEAMALVHKLDPEIIVSIVGEGEYASNLIDMVTSTNLEECVLFTGRKDHDEVIKMISNAYALILPTRFDAFPYVIIEAMSVGTPVIASDVGGIPELIRNGIEGYLIPKEEPERLAFAIMELTSDNELRNSMSKAAFTRFLQNFEISRAIQNQADYLEGLIKTKI